MKIKDTKNQFINGIPTSFTYGITEVGNTAYIHYIRKYACHWYHPRRLQGMEYAVDQTYRIALKLNNQNMEIEDLKIISGTSSLEIQWHQQSNPDVKEVQFCIDARDVRAVDFFLDEKEDLDALIDWLIEFRKRFDG